MLLPCLATKAVVLLGGSPHHMLFPHFCFPGTGGEGGGGGGLLPEPTVARRVASCPVTLVVAHVVPVAIKSLFVLRRSASGGGKYFFSFFNTLFRPYDEVCASSPQQGLFFVNQNVLFHLPLSASEMISIPS